MVDDDNKDNTQFWKLIHPAIINVARKRFETGYRYDAVEAAINALKDRVKELIIENTGSDACLKNGDKYLDGTALMNFAFNNSAPVIALNRLKTNSEKDIQNGYMHMFMGVMLAIRNPKAHDNIELREEEAMRVLVLLSHLFYVLDESVNYNELPKRRSVLDFIRSVTSEIESIREKKETWRSFKLEYKKYFLINMLSLLAEGQYDTSRLNPLSIIIKEGSESDAELVELLELVMDYTFTKNILKGNEKAQMFRFISFFMDLEPIKQVLVNKYLHNIIDIFVNRTNYNTANLASNLLNSVTSSLSDEEIKSITIAFIQNDQIYNAYDVLKNLHDVLLKGREMLNLEQKSKLDELLSNS